MSLFLYLFTFAISLWHRKFVTADVTAGFVYNEHGIQRRGQDFDKKKRTNTLSIHSYTRRGITSSSAMAERPRELDQRFQMGGSI